MNTSMFYATAAGFVVLTIVMYTLIFGELRKALGRTGWDEARRKRIFTRTTSVVLGWAALISILALGGFFKDLSVFPPRFLVALLLPLVGIIFVTFSATLRELLPHIPQKSIVRLQVFRLFVEILLWMLFIQNLIPIQMSFEGRNFDIFAGATAPLAAYFLANNRTGLIIWNITSLALLVNIVVTAVLSLPTPARVFMNEPASTIVTQFPFVWLPALLVPIAYGLAFFSLRQLAVTKPKVVTA